MSQCGFGDHGAMVILVKILSLKHYSLICIIIFPASN